MELACRLVLQKSRSQGRGVVKATFNDAQMVLPSREGYAAWASRPVVQWTGF